MKRQTRRAIKLTDGVTHQAICRTCSFAGTIRETKREAEIDAANHVYIPKNQNHRVSISTIETRVAAFKRRS